MADSWEDRQKRKKPVSLIFLVIIAIVFVGFLIRNNSNTFIQNEDTVPEEVPNDVSTPNVDTTKGNDAASSGDGEQEAGEAQKKVSQIPKRIDTSGNNAAVIDAPAVPSVDLPGVICALADKKGLSIRVSLKLYFKEKELEKEILFKREDIKLIVKKVFSTKHLSDIVVDVIRAELLKEINGFIQQGRINDIEFLDFVPIE